MDYLEDDDVIEALFKQLMMEASAEMDTDDPVAARQMAAERAYGEIVDRASDLLQLYCQ